MDGRADGPACLFTCLFFTERIFNIVAACLACPSLSLAQVPDVLAVCVAISPYDAELEAVCAERVHVECGWGSERATYRGQTVILSDVVPLARGEACGKGVRFVTRLCMDHVRSLVARIGQ